MDLQALQQEREQKDRFFKAHEQSPLTADQKQVFEGLSYYEPNPALDLTVTVTPFEQKSDVQLQTNTGEARWYRLYGEFRFHVGDDEARLTIYQTPHGFFLPFADAGAGTETYPAGRYLEPEQVDGQTFHIDFNRAYNPFCAYNDGWVCPMTPAENRLGIFIKAGERIPQGKWAKKAQ